MVLLLKETLFEVLHTPFAGAHPFVSYNTKLASPMSSTIPALSDCGIFRLEATAFGRVLCNAVAEDRACLPGSRRRFSL